MLHCSALVCRLPQTLNLRAVGAVRCKILLQMNFYRTLEGILAEGLGLQEAPL
jgi:hypothetical protein